jgi:hypothetical protein
MLVENIKYTIYRDPLAFEFLSVGIATGCGWTAGVLFPVGEMFFSSQQRPDRLWEPIQLPIQCVPRPVG